MRAQEGPLGKLQCDMQADAASSTWQIPQTVPPLVGLRLSAKLGPTVCGLSVALQLQRKGNFWAQLPILKFAALGMLAIASNMVTMAYRPSPALLPPLHAMHCNPYVPFGNGAACWIRYITYGEKMLGQLLDKSVFRATVRVNPTTSSNWSVPLFFVFTNVAARNSPLTCLESSCAGAAYTVRP